MSKASIELDFLGICNHHVSEAFPGTQTPISHINQELLRPLVAPTAVAHPLPFATFSPALANVGDRLVSPPPMATPLLTPTSMLAAESSPVTAPLTIFYDGMVAVFHLPRDKAEKVMKLAAEEEEEEGPMRWRSRDLTVARRRSLQLFLEKRKERLTALAPYKRSTTCNRGMASAG